ncbi:MAG: alpha/beta hydrolase [Gammaproteobacteria bacterium]|nr:alpha/beta hydrolase [Gammaproteobacteria bacterium]
MARRTDFFIPGPVGKLSARSTGLDKRPSNVVVLVQGANLTGQAGFDFSFPGGEDYSLMDALAARSLGAVTFALRGYGQSDAPDDPLTVDTDAAIEDLASVMDWLAAEGHPRPHLLGWSWGGRITARYGEQNPGRVARMVLLDPALGGGNLIPFEPEEPWWRGGWDYFFEREAQYGAEEMRRALADYVVEHEPRSPNGIRRENARGSIAADPEALACPVLMIFGSGAGKAAYMHGGIQRAEYFERLPAEDKALVLVPGGGDYAHLQPARHRIHEAIAGFLLKG